MISEELIKNFCDQCYETRYLFKEYVFLYESGNKERLDLLDKTARDFFCNIQSILIDKIFLSICKITDSAGSGKKSNLTVEYILKGVEQGARGELGLDGVSEDIHKFRESIVAARHKIIVHSDVETINSNETLGAFSKSKIDEFWKNLQEFINKIHMHYFDEPFIFDDIVDETANAKFLILGLKKAAYFDQHFKGVLHDELLEEKKFKFRNA